MYFPLMDFDQRAAEVRPTLGDGNLAGFAIYDRLIASIDRDAVRALQSKYSPYLVDFDRVGIYKYADLPFWLARFVVLAQRQSLDRLAGCTMLDIGTGAGHFLAVVEALGHRAVGTDIEVPVYADIAKVLGVDRRVAPVVARELHPDVGGPFDRITIYWQVFDFIRQHPDLTRDYWSLEDWTFLLSDLANHQASPAGTIHLELNMNYQKDVGFFNEPLMDFLEAHGATVDRTLAYIDLPAVGLRRDPAS